MRKHILDELDQAMEEETTTEMLELTCDELEGLSRAFEMISSLCIELQSEIALDPSLDISEFEIN